MKYNVLFIGCKPKGLDEIWGGSVATAYAYLKSFENSDKYNIIPVARDGIKTYDIIKSVLNKFEYDILHVDETSILNLMYNGGFEVPDVIGPVTRSPIKTYGKTWKSDYTEEYFYKAKVIRLNRSEEWLYKGRLDYTDKVHFINHGIHTELLKPSNNKNKNLILWAGDSERGAKGYEMWLDIQKYVKLPGKYEYKTLSNYNIKDYWDILDQTKILINTSLYETFCNAMFEAKSKAIPSIYKINLHNGRHLDGRIQVEYSVDGYADEIFKLLTDDEYYMNEAILSRKYTVDNFSLEMMRKTYSNVYDLVIKEKYGE